MTRTRALTVAVLDSVTQALDDGVTTTQKAVAALKVLLAAAVASELGVTIGFSVADGDS